MSNRKKIVRKISRRRRGPASAPRRPPMPLYRPPAARPRKTSSGASARVGSGVGSAIGGWLAPGIGGTVGGALGSGLGSLFSKITGVGDYKIQTNSLVRASAVPSFGENCVRIRHKEYLGDVFSTTAFASRSIQINPGLATSFPWLSGPANNYQEYYFLGLVYTFVSTSADALNSTNTALGKVAMATDYNAVDPNFTSIVQMLATEYSNYGKPNEDLLHAVECAPGQRPTLMQYIRSGGPPSGADIRLYDLGNFQLATQGMQAASNIGGIWVTYDVVLCKPVVPASLITQDHWFTSLIGSSVLLDNADLNVSTAPIGCTVDAKGSISLPPAVTSGTFKLTVLVYADGKTSQSFGTPLSTLVNCQLSTYPWLNATASLAANSNTTASVSATFIFIAYIDVLAPAAIIRTQLPTSGGTAGADIFLERILP